MFINSYAPPIAVAPHETDASAMKFIFWACVKEGLALKTAHRPHKIPEKDDNAGELYQAQIILSMVLIPPMPQAANNERQTQRPSSAASSAAHGLYFFFTFSLPNFVVLRTRTSALRENFTFSLPFPYQN
jgi:hypothetical protein